MSVAARSPARRPRRHRFENRSLDSLRCEGIASDRSRVRRIEWQLVAKVKIQSKPAGSMPASLTRLASLPSLIMCSPASPAAPMSMRRPPAIGVRRRRSDGRGFPQQDARPVFRRAVEDSSRSRRTRWHGGRLETGPHSARDALHVVVEHGDIVIEAHLVGMPLGRNES